MASSYDANSVTAGSTKTDVNTAFTFSHAQVFNDDGSDDAEIAFNDGDWITVQAGEHLTFDIDGDKLSYQRAGSNDASIRYVLIE